MDENEKYWLNLEKNYVHNVYETITNHYETLYKIVQKAKENENNYDNNHDTSTPASDEKINESYKVLFNAWPKVRKFITKLEPNSLLADVGCGEGKYLQLNYRIFPIGCDRSSSLCDFALKTNQSNQLLVCDNLALPFRSNLFDAVISIGVIHHFSTTSRRVKAVQELSRILAPGGKLMIYVWALEQKNRKFNSQDILVPLVSSNQPISTPSDSPQLNLKRDLTSNQSEPNMSKLEETKHKLNSLKKQSKIDHSNVPLRTNSFNSNKISDCEANLVDNFKSFFTRKFKSGSKETIINSETANADATSTTKTGKNNPFLSHEISKSFDMQTLERYRKILDEHRNVLPKDFTIREFPYSSCQDTFESADVELDESLTNCLNESSSARDLTSNESKNKSSDPDKALNDINSNNTSTNTNLNNDLDSNNNSNATTNANKRFYHVFKAKELDSLVIESCSDLDIYDSYYDHGNWCICAIKKL